MAAGTPTLNDMFVLANASAFTQRVASALFAACANIASEGWAVPFHRERSTFVVQVLSNTSSPNPYVQLFANAAATNLTVVSDATQASTNYTVLTTANVAAQVANITDTDINNAVAACFNSFVREPSN
jgi:hypothetical protein